MHIGPHKTGTTAVQSGMHEARDAMAEHGVYYPRGGWRRREAGWALGLPGRWSGVAQPPIERWTALSREVARAGDLRVCISNEDFGRADVATVPRIVHDLGGDRVHVVAVARRLDTYLPSQWQERIKAGHPRSFEGWLRVVLGDDATRYEHRNVWGAHDLAAMTKRWVDVVGRERFTLVVFDEADRAFLPHLFEQMLGLPVGTIVPSSRSNTGLSWSESEVLLALNRAAKRNGWPTEVHHRFIRDGVHPMLRRTNRAPGPRHPPFPRWALDEVRRRSDARIADLRELDVRVVGDLDALRVQTEPHPAGELAPDELTVPVDLAAELVESVIAAALRHDNSESEPAPER